MVQFAHRSEIRYEIGVSVDDAAKAATDLLLRLFHFWTPFMAAQIEESRDSPVKRSASSRYANSVWVATIAGVMRQPPIDDKQERHHGQ